MATKKKLLQAAAGAGSEPEGAWDLSYAYYNDPNGFDLDSARYVNFNKNVSTQETGPRGVSVSTDGTKMYVIGVSGDDVNEYDLSTPFRVTTATYVQNFSVASQETSPTAIFFKPDGTKMYITGWVNDDVNEYDLSTAWDVSTASYLQNFSVTGSVNGLFFRDDGLKMYTVDSSADRVYEYDLSTAWDVSTASSLQNLSVSAQETVPEGLSFKSDGTKMFVLGNTGNDVTEYDLSTAWDISTATVSTTFSVSARDSNPRGLFIDANGGYLYMVGTTSPQNVYQFAMGGLYVFSQDATVQDLHFKPDGTKMYIVGSGGDTVDEFDLSTAWDTSTASFNQSKSVAAEETTPVGLFFKYDGTKMYVIGSSGDDVNEYNLSTAWDVSTASYLQNFSVSSQDTVPTSLFFKGDGTKMYVLGSATDDVFEYDLSTAWDVSTASYNQNFAVTVETSPNGLFFKDDGTKMYVIGSTGDDVNEFDLSTAWDISTASYSQNFLLGSQTPSPNGVYFKPDGTQFFTSCSTTDRIHTYSLGVIGE